MENTENKQTVAFIQQLYALNQTVAAIFRSGDMELFTQLNQIVKEMYALQNGSEEIPLQAVEEDCQVIYKNFDMIVSVLRTTEEGVIDAGAQSALNKFLHNIHEASVLIATAFGLIKE